jgi:glycosyltransferase involved in cell wall biosynthesis
VVNTLLVPRLSDARISPGLGRAGPLRKFDVSRLSSVVYENRCEGEADVAVIISLYNYASTITETLTSVAKQDLEALAVIVVDDCSTDDGVQKATAFLKQHAARFTLARVVQHHRNHGPSMARNSGIAWSNEAYVFVLDADNHIRPPALSRLLEALHHSRADFAYSQLALFGDTEGIGDADVWDPSRLSIANYIDTMAMIRRDALLAAGGYAALEEEDGWEDYDLWCRFAQLGFEGVFLPELLCDYRVHGTSMLRSRTNSHYEPLMMEMALRHPGLVKPPGSAHPTSTMHDG